MISLWYSLICFLISLCQSTLQLRYGKGEVPKPKRPHLQCHAILHMWCFHFERIHPQRRPLGTSAEGLPRPWSTKNLLCTQVITCSVYSVGLAWVPPLRSQRIRRCSWDTVWKCHAERSGNRLLSNQRSSPNKASTIVTSITLEQIRNSERFDNFEMFQACNSNQ